jgi:hypothetical protein
MKSEEKSEERVCKKCNESKPLSDYRLYKGTILLSTCRSCERIQARERARSKSAKSDKSPKSQTSVFIVSTKSGKSFEVSLDSPFPGGRKATLGDKTLYVNSDNRDSVRAIFGVYFKLNTLTAIKTELVK